MDFGASNIRVVLGDSRGNILERFEEPTQKGENITEQIIRMVSSLKNLIKAEGLGIGSAGKINYRRGETTSPNVSLKPIPLTKPLHDKLKLPIFLLNDCSAAVFGEYKFGAGQGLENLVYVTISTGIGGGCIIDNHLLFGKDGNVAEIGHTVIDYHGELECGCGGRGHWEAYCSGRNIPNFARAWMNKISENERKTSKLYELSMSKEMNAKNIFNLARKGDKLTEIFINEVGRLNAIGLANVTNLYDPSLITLGGTVVLKNPTLMLNPIKKYLEGLAFNKIPEVRTTPLGDSATVYGALAAVFDKVGFPHE